MGIFGKKDKKPPLAKVIGSKGKGGWFGIGKKNKDDKKYKGY